jgi:hypothetical protein
VYNDIRSLEPEDRSFFGFSPCFADHHLAGKAIHMGNRIQMRAVQRASEIAEGIRPLAIYLGVAPALVAAWIEGTTEVPPAPFLKMVEIIVDHGASHVRGVIPLSLVEVFKHREAANW